MSFDEYMFKASGQIMRMFHGFDNYIPIFSLLQNILNNVTYPLVDRCKKIKDTPVNNHHIPVTQVYFKNTSSLRKTSMASTQLIFGIGEHNVENSWKMYEQEFKEKPKVGDIIEVHYTVPYEKENPHTKTTHFTHTPFVVSYIYPSNIHFPPYNIEELREADSKKGYKNGVLYAGCNGKDLTEETMRLSGPLGNFYSDVPTRYGIRVLRNTIVDKNVKDELVITDNNGDEFTFKPDSMITFYKKSQVDDFVINQNN